MSRLTITCRTMSASASTSRGSDRRWTSKVAPWAAALGPESMHGVIEQRPQVDLREHRRLGLRKTEQLPDHAVDAGEFLGHVAENAPRFFRLLLSGQHVDGGLGAGQRVADLVGETGRHLAKRGQLFHAGQVAALGLLLDLTRPPKPGRPCR